MILRKLLLLLLLLWARPCFIFAEDGDDGAEGDDQGNYDDGYSQNKICSKSDVEVTGLTLLCDSPGTFYYGSGKYRDSNSCKPGDKAKVTMTFDVVSDGLSDPLMTLIVKGDFEKRTIYKNARLCYLGTLKSTSYSSCPTTGSYQLTTQFYWNSHDDDDYYKNDSGFVPQVSVGFHTEKDPNQYDLGGANTNKCWGNSIITWTKNVKESGALSTPWVSFLWSFFILAGTVGILGMFAWYLWRRPQDNFARHYRETEFEDDDRKVSMVAVNRGLVDF